MPDFLSADEPCQLQSRKRKILGPRLAGACREWASEYRKYSKSPYKDTYGEPLPHFEGTRVFFFFCCSVFFVVGSLKEEPGRPVSE